MMLSSTERRTLIFGLGETGYSCARHLTRAGMRCVVADTRLDPPMAERLRNEWPEVEIHAGSVRPELLTACDEVVVSPGLDYSSPEVCAARQAGVNLVSDIDLFLRARTAHVPTAPLLAVTGSNGKSTVVALLGEMARAAGWDAGVGGNLGPPALDILADSRRLYILELSSFQLESTVTPLAARAAVVLNISPDHLDRHGDMDHYAQIKNRIYDDAEVMILNRDDSQVAAMRRQDPCVTFGLNPPNGREDWGVVSEEGGIWLVRGDEHLIDRSELPLVGHHHTANYLAALAMGEAAGYPISDMLRAMRSFTGLPHRTQVIAAHDGVVWMDDSKATNVAAATAAVASIGDGRRVILLAGGVGKGQDFSPLAGVVRTHVQAAVLFGEDAPAIESALAGCTDVRRVNDLDEATRLAYELAGPGDTVLLSPACASFDMFADYRDRGRRFAAAVHDVIGGGR